MKKITLLLVSSLIFTLSPLFISNVLGDQPPDPGGDPTGQPVGGSPIGSGFVIMVSLGIAYGAKKAFKHNWLEKNS